MLDFFDMDGNEISLNEWEEMFSRGDRVVGRDNVGKFLVSTMWLGIAHGYANGRPLIFETMIFDTEDGNSEVFLRRYSTREEADAGHQLALTAVKTAPDQFNNTSGE